MLDPQQNKLLLMNIFEDGTIEVLLISFNQPLILFPIWASCIQLKGQLTYERA